MPEPQVRRKGSSKLVVSNGKIVSVRRSVEKQERVVSALWEFVRSIQHHPDDGTAASLADGTQCSMKHIRSALEKIMDTFGFVITEIQ